MNKTFDHQFLEKKSLPRQYEDGKRFYVTPEGEHCISVTTALSVLSKKGIEKWQQRVGVEEADKISKHRANLGTMFHEACEHYLLNEDIGPMYPSTSFLFNTMKRHLDEHVGTIYGIEIPLYSTELKAAGTADLICDYRGKLSIVDFKTSTKPKNEKHILGYFLQSTTYAIMLNEMYNMQPEQIVILVAPDASPVQEIIKPIETYQKMTFDFWRHFQNGEFS